MPTLHVRNVPPRLHARLRKLAELEKRSLTAEVVALLGEGIESRERKSGQARLLAEIRRHRVNTPEGCPTSLDLLREDRER